MTEIINNISGKRFTFFQLINKYHISIPIIQRDYAQGRPSQSEVRIPFLKALYDYLDENKPNRDLDFVYGNKLRGDDGKLKFILLDGQQRLTTLFLLHWYLATKEGETKVEELKKVMVDSSNSSNLKSKFSYETRTSSREFCDALSINDNIDLDNLLADDIGKHNSLSKTIKDKSWFFLSWESDPTIQSMLVMLDAIHQKFKKTDKFYSRLVNPENHVITFQFLDIGEFNLTDDLYIKMNSRGIPLTPFENFKAKFEQFLAQSTFNNNYNYQLYFNKKTEHVNVKTYFSHKIDTDWSNVFWNYSGVNKKNFDGLIMNFIRAIVINNYANIISTEEIKFLIDQKNTHISFSQYNKFKIFELKDKKNPIEKINYKIDEIVITNIISLLDIIKNGENKIKTFLGDFHYYNELELFNIVLNNSFTGAGYVVRIKFYAYSQYLIKWNSDEGFKDIEGLKKWMRIIHNLTENTAPYNNENEFIRSIQSINDLIPRSNKIQDYLINNGNIEGFDKEQIKEERIKANLIQKENSVWEGFIFSIEKHEYFKGQIGFILFLSGIEIYYEENSNCDWEETEDIQFQDKYISYCDKAKFIFGYDGLNPFSQFLWERALLSIGDYLISEGSNQSFLINYDRDISWKRFLKRDKKIEHSNIVKKVFEVIDITNIEKSLTNIIDSYTENDWRGLFIKTPELFEYFDSKGSKRYVRKNTPHGFVLFKGQMMSGAHAELYSYSFYLNNLKDRIIKPFTRSKYYMASGDNISEFPCAFIDNWLVDVADYVIDIYFNNERNKYQVKFFNRNSNQIHSAIKDMLILEGMLVSEENSSFLFIQKDNQSDVINYLNSICEKLNMLEL